MSFTLQIPMMSCLFEWLRCEGNEDSLVDELISAGPVGPSFLEDGSHGTRNTIRL